SCRTSLLGSCDAMPWAPSRVTLSLETVVGSRAPWKHSLHPTEGRRWSCGQRAWAATQRAASDGSRWIAAIPREGAAGRDDRGYDLLGRGQLPECPLDVRQLGVDRRAVEHAVVDGQDGLRLQQVASRHGLFRCEHRGDATGRVAGKLHNGAVDRQERHVEGAEALGQSPPIAVPERVAAVDKALAPYLDDPGDLIVAEAVDGRHG